MRKLDQLAFPEFAGGGKFGFIVKEARTVSARATVDAFSDPARLQCVGEEGQKFAM